LKPYIATPEEKPPLFSSCGTRKTGRPQNTWQFAGIRESLWHRKMVLFGDKGPQGEFKQRSKQR
jgi:hypothetical protein